MTLSDAKFEENLTCYLENDMRNFANFYQSTRKCQNWNFDKMLLSKVGNVWAWNLQWSYVSFHLLYELLIWVISSLTYINQVILLQCGPLFCTLPRKVSLSPSVWARREYIWKFNWKESLYTDLFWKLTGCSLFPQVE